MISNESTLYDLEKLKLERARQGKSIRQVAELAMLDVKTIVRIEKHRVTPRIQTIGKIANALGRDVEEFIFNSSDAANTSPAICNNEQKESEIRGE